MAIKLTCDCNNVHNSIKALRTWTAEAQLGHAQDLMTVSLGQLPGPQWLYDASDRKT